MFRVAARHLVIFLFSALLLPVFVAADDYPIELEVISPVPAKKKGMGADPNAKSIQFRAGWPLTLRLTIQQDDFLGIGMFGDPFTDEHSTFGEINQGAAIVFDDPDGDYSPPPNNDFPADETLLTFFPDREMRGVEDETGFFTQQLALKDPSGRPKFGGPSLHGERSEDGLLFKDGWGWGADDDLPGLVILSNTGASLVLKDANFDGVFVPGVEEFGDRVVPAQIRNSAGFMTMVGYELTSARGDTRITASMLVPRHLYSSIRMIDLCRGLWAVDASSDTGFNCFGDSVARIDGGAFVPFDYSEIGADFDAEVELRAFVVAPHVGPSYEAINILEDINGDGEVTAADAELAGYVVLSNEVVVEFTQILNSNGFCNGSDTPSDDLQGNGRETDVFVDFDGNGVSGPLLFGCPGGRGGTSKPPR